MNTIQIDKIKLISIMRDLFYVPSFPKNEKPMQDFIHSFFESDENMYGFKKTMDKKGNIYLVRQDKVPFLPLLNAHMDSWMQTNFHEQGFPRKLIYNKDTSRITAPGYAIGCDDKVGIAMILYFAKYTKLEFKILLTVEEEVGMFGVQEVDAMFYRDVDFCFTLDRKGSTDIIQTYMNRVMCKNYHIENMKTLGNIIGLPLKVAEGVMADTYYIAEYVPSVNLSVGYYKAHEDNDYVIVNETIKMMEFVYLAITNLQFILNYGMKKEPILSEIDELDMIIREMASKELGLG